MERNIIDNFRCADDTVILAESEEQLTILNDLLSKESSTMELEINASKTKIMIFYRSSQEQVTVNIKVGSITH